MLRTDVALTVQTMVYGALERTAAVLKAVVENPFRAPTRVMTFSGVAYGFLRFLLDAELVEITGEKHYGKRLRITDKGHVFLKHYIMLEKLFPES